MRDGVDMEIALNEDRVHACGDLVEVLGSVRVREGEGIGIAHLAVDALVRLHGPSCEAQSARHLGSRHAQAVPRALFEHQIELGKLALDLVQVI